MNTTHPISAYIGTLTDRIDTERAESDQRFLKQAGELADARLENERLRKRVESLEKQVKELQSASDTLIDLVDFKYDIAQAIAQERPSDRHGRFTIPCDGPTIEVEASVGGMSQHGEFFGATLVGLVWSVEAR
ncbi:MAG TPA: hypothetical protein VHC22_32695 [Pirellulales bacterium]|nr:hypothetical protein [Pirellulales bacterium]